MRTRKVHLKPETFPFLAVLLCAMGALILLLLVMDRRAKVVAQNKARLDQAKLQETSSQDQARRQALHQAEIQRQQELLRQWNRQAGDQLAQLQNVQTQAITSSKKLTEEELRQRQLQQQALEIGERVRQLRDDLAQRKRSEIQVAKVADGARSEIEHQLIELRELQSTLESLKARAKLDQHTYSLIPYAGKYGDNRKPLYIECTYAGLIFHPDRLEFLGRRLAPREVRAEVERRIAQMRDYGKTTPYLMVLVRPSGIECYVLLRMALDGLEIDFGYELIDADWILDFSVDVVANGPPIAPITALPPVAPPLARIGSDLPGLHGVPGSSIGQGGGPGGPGGSSQGGTRFGSEQATGNGPISPISPIGPSRGSLSGNNSGRPGSARGLGGDSEGGWGLWGGGGKTTYLSNGAPKLADLVLGGGGSGSGAAGSGKGYSGLRNGNGPGGGPAFGTGVPGFGSGGPDGSGSGMAQGISVVAAPNYGVGGSPKGVMADGSWGNGSPGGGSLGNGPSGERLPGNGVPGNGSSGDRLPGNGVPGYGPPNPDWTGANASTAKGYGPPGNPNRIPGQQSGSPNTGQAATGDGQKPSDQNQGGPPGQGNPANNSGKAGQGVPGGSGNSTGGGGQGIPGGGDNSTGGGGQGVPGGGNSTDNAGSGTATLGGAMGMSVPSGSMDRNPGKRPPVTLSGLTGNRDWYIAIAIETDGVVLRPTGQRFTLAELTAKTTGESPLTQAVRQLVARRQATVRPGETPYRPLLRLQVAPGGLGTYYLAYPLLVPLRYNLEREGVH